MPPTALFKFSADWTKQDQGCDLYLGEDGPLPQPGLELVEHDGDGLPLLRRQLVHRSLVGG